MMTNRLTALMLAVLLVSSALVVATPVAADAGAASLQDDGNTTTAQNESETNDSNSGTDISKRGADLLIEQPSYVDGDPRQRSSGERPVYEASGDQFKILPQGFGAADVVDFGVSTDSGSMSYDPEWGHYEFSPEGQEGSFDVYWIVNYQEPGTNTTERVQFVATINVAEDASVAVLPSDQHHDLREDADRWEEHNATLTDLRESDFLLHNLLGNPDSNEEVFQLAVEAYENTRNPTAKVMEHYQAIIILILFTSGGWVLIAQMFGLSMFPLRELWRRLNVSNVNEPYEGELAERAAEQAKKDRLEVPANWDFQDMKSISDPKAMALREVEETPTSFYEHLRNATAWPKMCRDRLRIMSQSGYAAKLDDDDVLTDGGETDEEADLSEVIREEDAEVTIVDLDDELQPDEGMEDRDDLFPIDNPSESLVDAVKDDDTVWSFDPRVADYDPSKFDEPLEAHSLEELVEEIDPPMNYFEDKEEFGDALLDVSKWACEQYADEDGEIDPLAFGLNQLLLIEQEMADINGIPGAVARVEAIEDAVAQYDPTDDVDRQFRGVIDGASA